MILFGANSARRYRFPAWMRLRFRTLLVGVAFWALVLALVAEHRRHTEQEAVLAARDSERQELYQELMAEQNEFHKATLARTKMGFGEVTLAILEHPTTVERLEILRHSGWAAREQAMRLTGDTVIVYQARPTGEQLSGEFATELAAVLLDTNSYLDKGELVTVDDLPEPEFGFRLRRGSSRLDLLFSLETSEQNGHVDLFVQTWTDHGELVEGSRMGWRCLFQTTLKKMISPFKP